MENTKSFALNIYNLSFLFLVCSFLVWSGCVDKIEFDRPATIDNGIAIQGKLIKGSPSSIRVSVRNVFNFKEANQLLNVQSVELVNEQGQLLALESRREGLYEQALVDYPIDYGVGYKIVVTTFDNRIFESSFESILPTPSPTKLIGQFEIRERPNRAIGVIQEIEVIAFRLDTPLKNDDQATNSRLLWELGATYQVTDPLTGTCYVNISPFQNYVPFDGMAFNTEAIENIPLYETTPNGLFAGGYYLSVFQQSLSETAFDYWSQANVIINRSSSLLESPVGNITSNFTNINNPEEEVFGFFYAVEEKVIRTYISPSFAGFPEPPCRPCDCSFLEGNSEKPDWWVE